MPVRKTICIISNNHSTNDVRLYHKLARSLAKIARVYVIAARGVGSMMEHYTDEDEDKAGAPKPVRIIASGYTPFLRLFGIYRQAVKLKPDLVVCIEPLTMWAGLRLRRKTGCKLCYDAHEYYAMAHGERYPFPINWLASTLYYLFEHSLQEKMDLTLAVNDEIFQMFKLKTPEQVKKERETGKSFQEKYLRAPSRPGIVCPNYPTSAIFKEDLSVCNISHLIPDTKFDTIYLGGLSEERGILKLLQVIVQLRGKHPYLKALFIGPFKSEAFKSKFFEFLMANNLTSIVLWRDVIPHDKVCTVLKQARVGLAVMHPACKRYNKGVSLKMLEYLSVGIPVVTNDFPQLRDIIARHKLGYCVPFHRKDIQEAVEKLLALNPQEQEAMASKCRDVIRRYYLWNQVEPLLLETVSQLLGLTTN